MKSYFITLLIILMCATQGLYANYLRVGNVSYDQTAGTVTFDLAWNNSWRIDGMGAPNHWDAAWVFVKWRECNALPSVGWTHGLINVTPANSSFGNLEPMLTDGTNTTGIDAAPNNTGTMLRRNATGLFPNAGFTTITLTLTNFPAAGDYDVRVFGIEMVYVSQGEFIAGGTTETHATNQNGSPFIINSEAALTLNYYSTASMTVPANYPKGYDAFYCMKYEISQGQYADFLNTLDATSQSAHYFSFFNSSRNRITSGGTPPNVYFSDRPDRAAHYLAWTDLLAYLDWSCLRPMTDLEYEKAARGAGPYVGGCAWGTTDITEIVTVGTPEDGTEVSLTNGANAHYTSNNLSGGDGGNGPIRVGIFATAATSTRLTTGASYYGIMEMSGNVWEQCIVLYPDPEYTDFDAQWGNGSLDASGFADVANWPFANVAIDTNGYHRQARGGAYNTAATSLRIANKPYFLGVNRNNRTAAYGGRGVR